MPDRLLALVSAFAAAGCTASPAPPPERSASYLAVWAGDADEQESDFLAILDADPQSPRYGDVIATLPVGERALMPHHTDYESPADHRLFANGWKAGRSFVIDLADPLAPRLVSAFDARGGFTYPHSFERLSNGHRLAVFQSSSATYSPIGGLVELDEDGRFVRGSSSHTEEMPDALNWPYSLYVDEGRGLVVTTSTDMGMPPWDDWTFGDTRFLQTWSLDDLSLNASFALPDAPGGGPQHLWPAEPRRLANGAVMVNTFACGLYRLHDIEAASPSAAFVYAFPGGKEPDEGCSVPLVVGDYWIQTASAINGLIVLDLTDPSAPVEVSRLVLPQDLHMPHWLAAERTSDRLVLSGGDMDWVLMLRFDPTTGDVRIDESFRDPATGRLGARFDREEWPHGRTGPARVHGTLFR